MSLVGRTVRRRKYKYTPRPKVSLATKKYVTRRINANKDLIQQETRTASQNAAYDSAAIIKIAVPNGTFAAGEKVEMVKIDARFLFEAQAAAGATFCRCIILQWFHDNNLAADPASSDVFNGALDNRAFLAGIDVTNDNSTDFKVLKDFVVKLGENTAVEGTDKAYRRVLITRKMLQRKYQYLTGTQLGRNAVYAVVISDIANASTPPQVACNSMLTHRGEAAV